MNGEFIQARIKLNARRCSQLADEYAGLIWDERAAKREEHPNCANDLADAALYAWRLCYSYLSVAIDPPPKVGSPEWYEQEEEEMRMKKSFFNGAFVKLATAVYALVLSTSSLVAAQIPPAANSLTPVAVVNGQSISDAELASAAAAQLRQLDLQEYQLKKEVLESLVNQKLLEAEARRRGIPADKLLEQDVDAQVGEASDLELRAYYLGQKDHLNRPLVEIEPQLRAGLRQSRIQQARQDYFKGLRESAGVAILLRPPKVDVSPDAGRLRGNPQAPITIVERGADTEGTVGQIRRPREPGIPRLPAVPDSPPGAACRGGLPLCRRAGKVLGISRLAFRQSVDASGARPHRKCAQARPGREAFCDLPDQRKIPKPCAIGLSSRPESRCDRHSGVFYQWHLFEWQSAHRGILPNHRRRTRRDPYEIVSGN